jgi:hypothetical protein
MEHYLWHSCPEAASCTAQSWARQRKCAAPTLEGAKQKMMLHLMRSVLHLAELEEPEAQEVAARIIEACPPVCEVWEDEDAEAARKRPSEVAEATRKRPHAKVADNNTGPPPPLPPSRPASCSSSQDASSVALANTIEKSLLAVRHCKMLCTKMNAAFVQQEMELIKARGSLKK